MKRIGVFVAAFWMLAHGALAQTSINDYPVDENDKTPPSELKARRNQVKGMMGPGSLGVFFTNPVRNRNNDMDFQFRGDSNFLYLTGFEEPSSALLLVPDGVTVDGRRTTEILFTNEPNLQSITWLGYRMGPANAERLLGIEMALPNKRFAEVVAEAMKAAPTVSVAPIPEGPVGVLGTMIAALNQSRDALKPAEGVKLGPVLTQMRGIKSAYEIQMLRKVCDISARAHLQAMKTIKPGMREWEIGALMQYCFAREGCEFYGYPPICGSGPNSTILHYMANRRLMNRGEIYCMDSAGEYHGYSADVTRTFPVSGKFSTEQRAIYKVVFDAQELGISLCKPGAKVSDIGKAISAKLAEGMIRLGIIKEAKELGQYYMHGFGHGIGLDVHDPMPGTLVPGVALTVEPGIYIKSGSPCDPKYWNIGVRIEDDILVTEKGPENMSSAAPRRIEEIEKVMGSR